MGFWQTTSSDVMKLAARRIVSVTRISRNLISFYVQYWLSNKMIFELQPFQIYLMLEIQWNPAIFIQVNFILCLKYLKLLLGWIHSSVQKMQISFEIVYIAFSFSFANQNRSACEILISNKNESILIYSVYGLSLSSKAHHSERHTINPERIKEKC